MCLIRLPTEIIQQIVINLADDTRALVALSLSSKSLCPSAQRRLFQRVKLHSRCSRRLDSVLSSNPSLASYVKRLIIIHYIPNPRCKTLADGSYKLIPSRKCDDAAIISILEKLSSSPIRSITLFSTDSTTPIDWFTLENAFRTAFLGIIGQPLLRELAILNIFNIPTDTLNRCENLERLSTQLPLFQRALSVPVPTSTGGALPVGGGVSAQEDARSGMFPPAAQESRGRTSTQLVHYPITLNLHISVDGTLQDLESLRSSIGLFKVERFALTFSVPIPSVPVLQLLSQLTAIEELYFGFTWIGIPKIDIQTLASRPPTRYISKLPPDFLSDLATTLNTISVPHPSLTTLGIILYSSSPDDVNIPIEELKSIVGPLSRLHNAPGSLLNTISLVIGGPDGFKGFEKLEKSIRSVLTGTGLMRFCKFASGRIEHEIMIGGRW